jgi:hypothetical protein
VRFIPKRRGFQRSTLTYSISRLLRPLPPKSSTTSLSSRKSALPSVLRADLRYPRQIRWICKSMMYFFQMFPTRTLTLL